jgi:hypothetical protein
MYIHADMRGSGTLLLALDGVPVGLVVEADTLEGWVRRYDTRGLEDDLRRGSAAAGKEYPDWKQKAEDRGRRIAACPIVRMEGKVDFIGDTATDPDWMIAQRLAAVRIRHGLPIDVSIAHDTGGMAASVLERLAAQLRKGSLVATNLGQTQSADRFPLPEGKMQHVQTGRMRVSVDYESPDAVRAHEDAKTAWSREHPERVPEYVKRLAEGKAEIIEEVETSIDHRVRSTRLRSETRK